MGRRSSCAHARPARVTGARRRRPVDAGRACGHRSWGLFALLSVSCRTPGARGHTRQGGSGDERAAGQAAGLLGRRLLRAAGAPFAPGRLPRGAGQPQQRHRTPARGRHHGSRTITSSALRSPRSPSASTGGPARTRRAARPSAAGSCRCALQPLAEDRGPPVRGGRRPSTTATGAARSASTTAGSAERSVSCTTSASTRARPSSQCSMSSGLRVASTTAHTATGVQMASIWAIQYASERSGASTATIVTRAGRGGVLTTAQRGVDGAHPAGLGGQAHQVTAGRPLHPVGVQAHGRGERAGGAQRLDARATTKSTSPAPVGTRGLRQPLRAPGSARRRCRRPRRPR